MGGQASTEEAPRQDEGDTQSHNNKRKADTLEAKGTDPLLQVRAVTAFIVLTKDSSTWEPNIVQAALFCNRVATAINAIGFEVQTLRIVTNSYGEYLDTSSESAALAGMAILAKILAGSKMPPIRIRFAIGSANSPSDLALAPALISNFGDLANICVNIGVDSLGVPDPAMCALAAECVQKLAKNTPSGEGNFNFTANFNCSPLIPYFPAGYNTNYANSFCIGLQYPDLLVDVLQRMTPPVDWTAAFTAILAELQPRVDSIAQVAKKCATEAGSTFLGLDSSPAPSKNVKSMCQVFQLLGAEFGGPGTLKCCAYLTRLFKSVKNVQLLGFSGLMLTCLEDQGMADSAQKGAYNITMLNAYSAVCGIGLDCVPIPGDTPSDKIEALMADTGTLAFRLSKPLTVRLFPCPGLKAGQMTQFTSPDLCNCTVFADRKSVV